MTASSPSITITVRYWAQAALAAGVNRQKVTLAAGQRVQELLRLLVAEHAALETLITDVSEAKRGVVVFINEEQMPESHLLADGDEVMVLAPMAGG